MRKFKTILLLFLAAVCMFAFAACETNDDSEQMEKVLTILKENNIPVIGDVEIDREYYKPWYTGPINGGHLYKLGITRSITGFSDSEIFEINWYITDERADEAEDKLKSDYYRNGRMIANVTQALSSEPIIILDLLRDELEN